MDMDHGQEKQDRRGEERAGETTARTELRTHLITSVISPPLKHMTYKPAVLESPSEVGEHEPVGEDVGEPSENWASRRYELEGLRGLISVRVSIA